MYNLNLLKGYFGTHHLFGWNIIRDEILKNFKHNEDGIILDIFCERTFHSSWEKNWISKDYIYPNIWIGIIHTTPKKDDYSEHNETIENLFYNHRFTKSLDKCKALIVLGKSSYDYICGYLYKNKYNIPVHLTQHPFPEISNNKKFNFYNFLENKRINHVGIHMRNIQSFEKIKYTKKRLCYPKIFPAFDKKYFIENYIPHMNISNIEIEHLSKEKYEKMLNCEIIFNNIYDMAGSNLICECIRYNTPIVINRTKQLEELLGEKYPMFYDSIDDANLLIQNNELIKETNQYLKIIEYKISFKPFINLLLNLK